MENDKPEKSGLIIDITEIYDHRKRKEDELAFYQKELEKLMLRMDIVSREIDVTKTIISMIEKEQVIDLREQMRGKKK
jgi:hypothetical protein